MLYVMFIHEILVQSSSKVSKFCIVNIEKYILEWKQCDPENWQIYTAQSPLYLLSDG